MRGLDMQLQQGAAVLNQQLKQQQEYLQRMGDQTKLQFALQVDHQIKAQEMDLVSQHNQQLLMLQKTAQHMKAALEQQANALTLEYTSKKSMEDLQAQLFKWDKESTEAGIRYHAEMQALQQQQLVAAQQAAAQGIALAHQATVSSMQAAAAQQAGPASLRLMTSRTSASLAAPMPNPLPPPPLPMQSPALEAYAMPPATSVALPMPPASVAMSMPPPPLPMGTATAIMSQPML